MSSSGVEEVNGRLRAFIQQAGGEFTERALTELLIAGGARASELTPIDTSTLINSQERQVFKRSDGWRGVLYYGALYAPYVHNASGKLKGQPREDFGVTRDGRAFGGGTGKGRYWDPNAEPGFLTKGMEGAAEMDAPEIIRRIYGV